MTAGMEREVMGSVDREAEERWQTGEQRQDRLSII